jgi:hypothetical protein
MTALPCENRLALERANHTQAFQTLAASFDRLSADLASEREAHRSTSLALFRSKARGWFAKEAGRHG